MTHAASATTSTATSTVVVRGVAALEDVPLTPRLVSCADPAAPVGESPVRPVVTMGPATPPRGPASFQFVGDDTSSVGFALNSWAGPFAKLDMSLHVTASVTGVM